MLDVSFVIAGNHPTLPGHFPGYPITPGVVTLDHVANGLLKQLAKKNVIGFPQVKFLQPLLPEVEVTVSYKIKRDNLYQFSCVCDGNIILSGQIRTVIKSSVS